MRIKDLIVYFVIPLEYDILEIHHDTQAPFKVSTKKGNFHDYSYNNRWHSVQGILFIRYIHRQQDLYMVLVGELSKLLLSQ